MLTTAQAAERLGLTPGRIRQLARAGVLRSVKIGRDWLYRLEDVEEYDRNRHLPREVVAR